MARPTCTACCTGWRRRTLLGWPTWSTSTGKEKLSLCQLSLGWELPVPLPAPTALLPGGRCRPQRPWGSSSLPPSKSAGPDLTCSALQTTLYTERERDLGKTCLDFQHALPPQTACLLAPLWRTGGELAPPPEAVATALQDLTCALAPLPVCLPCLCQSLLSHRPEEVEVVRYDGRTQRAVAFVTPEDRLIREGLPPPGRCGATSAGRACMQPGWRAGSVLHSLGKGSLGPLGAAPTLGCSPARAPTCNSPSLPQVLGAAAGGG